MRVYIDLNVFDRLEKIDNLPVNEKPDYQLLLELLLNQTITTAYSNAHLNDLFRGYQKNPAYIDGHLNNIEKLTKSLCICQYWGDSSVTWHYRDIFEFFKAKNSEWEFEPSNYEDLFKDEPFLKHASELYKNIPLPDTFKSGYVEPMFGIMFPLSKIQNTYYSLHSDIYNLQCRLKSDYGLYKSLKTYLLTSLNKMRSSKDFIKSISSNFKDLPKHLEITQIYDAVTPENKTSDNILYSKLIETFFKYDLAGYKTDGHFNNMFDDAIHCFYASHFDVFITNDDRCNYKAKKTYEKLNIQTTVIKIEEITSLGFDQSS